MVKNNVLLSNDKNYYFYNEEFVEILKRFEDYDVKREELIKKSRDVLKLSKQIIYELHRMHRIDYHLNDKVLANDRLLNKTKNKRVVGKEENSKLKSNLEFIKKEISILKKFGLEGEGSHKIAMQEYVEAIAFNKFLNDRKLLTLKESKASDEEYLLGIMDLSGEIFRFGMNSAISGDYEIPVECLNFLDELYGELLKFNFRNSELRRKFDSVKYDLQKLEKLVFDVKFRK